jgi:hypothetical protein
MIDPGVLIPRGGASCLRIAIPSMVPLPGPLVRRSPAPTSISCCLTSTLMVWQSCGVRSPSRVRARALGSAAQEVADRWFLETAVRVHRVGEGAPFTGLKPAGLDVGPVIPAAERAVDVGSASELVDVLCASVREQAEQRHGHAMVLKEHAAEGVNEARAYVDAVLGLQVWAHGVYRQVTAAPHAHVGADDHN